MFNIDRHIAISAGWVAGPAFGVAMMAAPEYFHLGPMASALLFWGGIIVFFATIIVVAIVSLHEKNKQRAVIGPLILMVGGAFVICGGAAWYFWPSKAETRAEKSPLDNMVQISSSPTSYPSVVPQNKMFELKLNDKEALDIGSFYFWGSSAGTQLTRNPATMPKFGSLIRISNYGKVVLVNATMRFRVEFLAPEKSENRTYPGRVTKSLAVTSPPFSLGPGESVDIYAMNYSIDAYAEVILPTNAEAFIPGSDKEVTFKLITEVFEADMLDPFVPKSPLDQPHPAPSKQGKK